MALFCCYDNSNVIVTLIITNFHLYLIQLGWYSVIFPNPNCINSNMGGIDPEKPSPLNHLKSNVKYLTAVQSKLDQSRVGQNSLEQVEAVKSRLEQCRVGQSSVEQVRAVKSRLEQCRVGQSSEEQVGAVWSCLKQ